MMSNTHTLIARCEISGVISFIVNYQAEVYYKKTIPVC